MESPFYFILLNMNRNELLKLKIKRSNKILDFNWVNSQRQKGRIFINGNTVTDAIFNQLRLAIKSTNEIYEGLWDIDFQVTIASRKTHIDIKGIVIRFPQIHMTNSRNTTHTIKDLFVRIPLYKEGSMLKVASIEGGRMTLSYAEWCSSYLHSHLRPFDKTGMQRNPLPIFSTFCTGSGHINDFMSNINGDGLTETRFTSFLIQILSLLSWESLEGTPYITMSSVRISTSGAQGRVFMPSKQIAVSLKDTIINFHKENNLLPKITYDLSGEQYIIKHDDKFEDFLKSAPLSEGQKSNFWCTQNTQGTYYKYGSEPNRENTRIPNITNKYIFRGVDVPFTIEGLPERIQESILYVIHPTIKEYVKQELEYDTNIKKIRKSTIDRYSN